MLESLMIIEEPTQCPACQFKLVKINDQLFCKNVSCEAQVSAKILHFCQTLGIKGLGPKTLEKLQIFDLMEIYYLDQSVLEDAVGEKVASKLLNEIEKSKHATLATVLEAFSIPLVGGTASKKLASVIKSIDDITEGKCKEAGLGEKATANILDWLQYEWVNYKEFAPFVFKESDPLQDSTKTVCITGKLKSYKKKADAEAVLTTAGFTPVDSVTKTTKYLIDEEGGNSAKRQKAEKYGIIIITDLNDLLQGNY